MAVWVHKGEESMLVDALHLQDAMAGGWSVKKEVKEDELRDEKETDEKSEETSEADEEAIRLLGKERGIKGWHLMKIETLRGKLNAD